MQYSTFWYFIENQYTKYTVSTNILAKLITVLCTCNEISMSGQILLLTIMTEYKYIKKNTNTWYNMIWHSIDILYWTAHHIMSCQIFIHYSTCLSPRQLNAWNKKYIKNILTNAVGKIEFQRWIALAASDQD
jgi:hypothetical protein